MRILVTIPHYFGPSHPENNLPAIGSYIEPLVRVAALSETIVALHRHFGPNRHMGDASAIDVDSASPERKVDIVILALRGHELTAELGLDAGVIETRYVDCKPPWIAFEAQRVFQERLGQYDFYCLMEDDLVIHDPAFFDKLSWFQQNFGPQSLLMPVRCEIPATGTPAKVVIDFDLEGWGYRPFRRAGQRQEIEGIWNGQRQSFCLPKNPHAGSFFLTAEQMDYWVKQPTYGDADVSWMGPIESAGTFSVGRVFDLYKPLRPDPFFLEVEHFGVRYAAKFPPGGRRYGEPPLLGIAQNAIRAALDPGKIQDIADQDIADNEGGMAGPSVSRLFRHWLSQGTAVELRAQMDALQAKVSAQAEELEARGFVGDHAQGSPLPYYEKLKRQNAQLGQHNEDLLRHNEGLEQDKANLQRHTAAFEKHNADLLRHIEGLEKHIQNLEKLRRDKDGS
jgi:hypothetical protein